MAEAQTLTYDSNEQPEGELTTEEKESLENLLKSKRGSRVKIITPIRGERKKLVNMVVENANQVYLRRQIMFYI